MYLRFLQRDSAEYRDEVLQFPLKYEGSFKYFPGKSPRFDTKIIHENYSLLGHFSRFISGFSNGASLTYERAYFTNHDEPLILEAARRSERRHWQKLLTYWEGIYTIYLRQHQSYIEDHAGHTRKTKDVKKLLETMPLAPTWLAIMQYCHMLSPMKYQDDTHRISGPIIDAHILLQELPGHLLDIPFPIPRHLAQYNPEARKRPKTAWFELPRSRKLLNAPTPQRDFLHWDEAPLDDHFSRIVPEWVQCCHCATNMYFDQDPPYYDTWMAFLDGEAVLCRYCGASNQACSIPWRYLREHMITLQEGDQAREPGGDKEKRHAYPDLKGRYQFGDAVGKYHMEQLFARSTSPENRERMLELLQERDGNEEDWVDLQKLAEKMDVDGGIRMNKTIEIDSRDLWSNFVASYKSTLFPTTSLNLKDSITNLRNFSRTLDQLYTLRTSDVNDAAPPTAMEKFKSRFSPDALVHIHYNPLPAGSTAAYEKFMQLKAQYPLEPLLPTIAIELVWRTHLLHPAYYHSWCLSKYNSWIIHDFSTIEDRSHAVIKARYELTCKLWQEFHREAYLPSDNGINWEQHFAIGTEFHPDGSSTNSQIAGRVLKTSSEHDLTIARITQQKADYEPSLPPPRENGDIDPFEIPSPQPALFTDTEQTELYHTLISTPKERHLLTTKLVLDALLSSSAAGDYSFNPDSSFTNLSLNDTLDSIFPSNSYLDQKTYPLRLFITTNWHPIEHGHTLISFIQRFPVLMQKLNEHVTIIVEAIHTLFRLMVIDTFSKESLFPRPINPTGKQCLTKGIDQKLLLWLLCRNHPLLRDSREETEEFFRRLHLAGMLRNGLEMHPADLESERVISFLEGFYPGFIERVLRGAEVLLGEVDGREGCLKKWAGTGEGVRVYEGVEIGKGRQRQRNRGDKGKGKEKAKETGRRRTYRGTTMTIPTGYGMANAGDYGFDAGSGEYDPFNYLLTPQHAGADGTGIGSSSNLGLATTTDGGDNQGAGTTKSPKGKGKAKVATALYGTGSDSEWEAGYSGGSTKYEASSSGETVKGRRVSDRTDGTGGTGGSSWGDGVGGGSGMAL